MCPVCRGRGEVAAGIVTGIKEGPPYLPGKNWKGETIMTSRCEPTGFAVNPAALCQIKTGKCSTDYKDFWLLVDNPFGHLWGIAVCATCQGSGHI